MDELSFGLEKRPKWKNMKKNWEKLSLKNAS